MNRKRGLAQFAVISPKTVYFHLEDIAGKF